MKFFDKLFRRQKGSRGIVTVEKPPTDMQKAASTYYIDLLLKVEDLKPMTKEKEFKKSIKEIPTDKVAVFFNLEVLGAANENTFVDLDDYINTAKEKRPEKAFYRGLKHGPCVLHAFTKDCIPDKFNGSCFIGLPTAVLYL